MNKKVASLCIMTIMATVVLGVFFVNRASAQALAVNAAIFSGLSPFPKFVANDLDIVYVMVMAGPSGGMSPYTVEIWIRQAPDPWQRWAHFEQAYTGSTLPILWSTNAPTTEAYRTVDIYVTVTDATMTTASQTFTILIPMSSPTA